MLLNTYRKSALPIQNLPIVFAPKHHEEAMLSVMICDAGARCLTYKILPKLADFILHYITAYYSDNTEHLVTLQCDLLVYYCVCCFLQSMKNPLTAVANYQVSINCLSLFTVSACFIFAHMKLELPQLHCFP